MLLPAEAGKVAQGLEVVGLPPRTAYEWATDVHSGWVLPAQAVTDDKGSFRGTWIPGFPGPGRLVLTFSESGEDRVIEYETLSVAPAQPPWSQVALRARTSVSVCRLK